MLLVTRRVSPNRGLWATWVMVFMTCRVRAPNCPNRPWRSRDRPSVVFRARGTALGSISGAEVRRAVYLPWAGADCGGTGGPLTTSIRAMPVAVPALTGLTAADVMVSAPKTLGPNATVGDARRFFEDDHVHMALIATGGVLLGTLV